MEKIKILIVGFGNIGRAVLQALPYYPDLECVGIITRRPASIAGEIKDIKIFGLFKGAWALLEADVAILCGGSKRDLPFHGPMFAEFYNTICSFDTHGKIDNYIDEETETEEKGYYHIMHEIALKNDRTALVCQGWDPGIFSSMRALFEACLGEAKAEGFYGLTERGGLSMGHSDAIRTIRGVKDARQYTHAIPQAIESMYSGSNPLLSPGEMHWRECFVVADGSRDEKEIEKEIINMPDYFKPFRTTIKFISQEELDLLHGDMPHDGIVISVAKHGSMKFENTWKSNPRGTAGIILAFARATARLSEKGRFGAFTALDIPARLLLRDPESHLKFI